MNADNRTFLAARYLATTPSASAAPYRRIVRQVFNPGRGAAELVNHQADAVIERFRPRFAKIVRDTGKIGWGFHEGLEDVYWEFLPEADELG